MKIDDKKEIKCKCGKELVCEERKDKYTTFASAVEPTVKVIDTYSCRKCHAVLKYTSLYNKEEVLKAIEVLKKEDVVELMSEGWLKS